LGIPCNAGHFTLFALLGAAFAVRYATSDAARRAPRRTLIMVVLALWIVAALTEWGQQWVDNHEPKLEDWLIDMAGGIFGMLAGSYLARLLLQLRRD
jgi:VanZ family protein